MLLKNNRRRGSLCLELLLFMPLLVGIFISLIWGQLFFLESLYLDQATYETVKSMVSIEIAGTAFGSVLGEQSESIISSLWGIGLSGDSAKKLILAHDTSGRLTEENMEQVKIKKKDDVLQVFCRYRSSFLPDLFIESRAAERSWKP